MNARFPTSAAALLLVLTPGLCRAGLDFDKPEQQVKVKVSDVQIPASFAFTVSGDRPVKITDIHPFCSCVKAETSDKKMSYAPGDKAAIDLLFEVGGFEGVLKKEVLISTDDPKQPQIRLVLEATIPPLYEITPAQLVWQAGAEPVTQAVRLKVLGDDPIHITAAVPSRNGMTATVKEITAGREYEVDVTPATTEKKMLGLVRLELDSKYPRYQKRLVFFNITDKAPGEPGGPPAAAPGGPPAEPAGAKTAQTTKP